MTRPLLFWELDRDIHPKSYYVSAAKKFIELKEWDDLKVAEEINTIESYNNFLQKHPKGDLSSSVKRKIDEIPWAKAKAEDTITAYEIFIKENPTNQYVKSAKDRIDEIPWSLSKQEDTIECYNQFVKNNPANKFIPLAKQRMVELQRGIAAKKNIAARKRIYLSLNVPPMMKVRWSGNSRDFIIDLAEKNKSDKEWEPLIRQAVQAVLDSYDVLIVPEKQDVDLYIKFKGYSEFSPSPMQESSELLFDTQIEVRAQDNTVLYAKRWTVPFLSDRNEDHYSKYFNRSGSVKRYVIIDDFKNMLVTNLNGVYQSHL